MSALPFIPPDPRLAGKKIEIDVFDLFKPGELQRLSQIKTGMLKRTCEILTEERTTTPGGRILVYLEWIEYQKISAALGEIDPDSPMVDPVDEEDYEDQVSGSPSAKMRLDADELDTLKAEIEADKS